MRIVKKGDLWEMAHDPKTGTFGNDTKLKQRVLDLYPLYIDRYFEGFSWKTRKEPYIHFKHLFRTFLYEKGLSSPLIAELEGIATDITVGHDSILNSKDKTNLPIHPILKQDIHKFLNENWQMSLQQKVRDKISRFTQKGYTTEDIARHCLVHEQAIYKVINTETVSTNILKQIQNELINDG